MSAPFSAPANPFSLFHNWMEDAKKSEPFDPDAACLSTVDPDGLPNARVVLIRKIDERGFCFFTNYDSAKGQELIQSGKAAINFHWKTLKRQVRVRGAVSKVSAAESDDYYATRPMGNRIGAWASLQSRPLPDRETLIARVNEFETKLGDHPPRPDHWGGFRLTPLSIEFWQEGEARLHNRVTYSRQGDIWSLSRLYP
jgi:pyridoxamine 5'-phosphate oxidase